MEFTSEGGILRKKLTRLKFVQIHKSQGCKINDDKFRFDRSNFTKNRIDDNVITSSQRHVQQTYHFVNLFFLFFIFFFFFYTHLKLTMRTDKQRYIDLNGLRHIHKYILDTYAIEPRLYNATMIKYYFPVTVLWI